MRPAAALLALLAASAASGAEVTVRVNGGQVDLTAKAAPVADVLDRLARQTGMKVVYEGPAPRQLVTLSLNGRTPTEAVLDVLEGLGINFALVADATGARVQTLVVAGTASTSTSASPVSSPTSGRSSPGPRRPFGPPPGASPDVEPPFDEPMEEPELEDPAFQGVPPGAEGTEPGGIPNIPEPGQADTAVPSAFPPGVAPPPTPAMPSFPSSPFAPQPQPLPLPVPAAPSTPPGQPQEGPVPTVPPPP